MGRRLGAVCPGRLQKKTAAEDLRAGEWRIQSNQLVQRRQSEPTPNLKREYSPFEHLSNPPWQMWWPMIAQRVMMPSESSCMQTGRARA